MNLHRSHEPERMPRHPPTQNAPRASVATLRIHESSIPLLRLGRFAGSAGTQSFGESLHLRWTGESIDGVEWQLR
jgi:hypothetical protein